jgi:hypothetical protein
MTALPVADLSFGFRYTNDGNSVAYYYIWKGCRFEMFPSKQTSETVKSLDAEKGTYHSVRQPFL